MRAGWMRVVALAAAAIGSAGPTAAPVGAPIEVMVLGTYHFNGGGSDVVNTKVAPVTTPARQAELARIAAALARFRPTAVAVERVADDPLTMVDPGYATFTPERLETVVNERDQIGYRLARAAGLAADRVWAVDEQDRPGEESYFPFEKVQDWAKANGRTADLDAAFAVVRQRSAAFEERQQHATIAELLRERNTPGGFEQDGGIALYYGLLQFGRGDTLPGANLDGRWYTRNAMIFAKLMQKARPGDRIVLVYGSGHNYWLRHFASTVPGFKLIEPNAYLPPR